MYSRNLSSTLSLLILTSLAFGCGLASDTDPASRQLDPVEAERAAFAAPG